MTFADIARIPEKEMPQRVNEVIEKLLPSFFVPMFTIFHLIAVFQAQAVTCAKG
jgi:hypothetical protein